jgi:DNA-binding Xre family transcriptional regulator
MARVQLNAVKLAALQAKKNKSSWELMCDADIAGSTLVRALAGKRINIRTAGCISRALECDLEELITQA